MKQLLTIHAQFRDELFSCAYIVLPDKESETYSIIFNKLKEILLTNGSIIVKQIMADFEAALVNQLKTTFSMAVIKGCWFHFNQAIIRKLFNLGLHLVFFINFFYLILSIFQGCKTLYLKNFEFKIWIRRLGF